MARFALLHKRSEGVISLEFIFVLPLLVGLLYAGMVYGMLFFSKVELQRTVDAAVSSVYYLDRRNVDPNDGVNFGQVVSDHAEAALGRASGLLSSRLKLNVSECGVAPLAGGSGGVTEIDIVLLTCSITVTPAEGRDSFLPQLNLSYLGSFPPQPPTLSASAAVTF